MNQLIEEIMYQTGVTKHLYSSKDLSGYIVDAETLHRFAGLIEETKQKQEKDVLDQVIVLIEKYTKANSENDNVVDLLNHLSSKVKQLKE